VATGAPARLTVLSGPSGVGKGTVVAEVRRRYPEVWVSVSVTTRSPRPGEVDGVDYHFVDDREFDRLIAADGLLEWAEYAGNRYGTPVAPLRARLAGGAPALLEIELQGARQVRARDADAQLVFLAPPSWAVLVDRLAGRGSEPPAVQERRLALAQAELDAAGEFDVVVVNDDVSRAADELVGLLTAPPPGTSRDGSAAE
jgi:guanylate kinase